MADSSERRTTRRTADEWIVLGDDQRVRASEIVAYIKSEGKFGVPETHVFVRGLEGCFIVGGHREVERLDRVLRGKSGGSTP